MRAAAHDPGFAKRMGIAQTDARKMVKDSDKPQKGYSRDRKSREASRYGKGKS